MNKFRKFLKILPVIVCVVFTIIFFIYRDRINADTIRSFIPDASLLSAMVLVILYALKSISMTFPVAWLQAAAGMVFPTPVALLINLIGITIVLTIPYMIGRISDIGFTENIIEKYPLIKKIQKAQDRNPFLISLFMRAIVILPGDPVSMYLGGSGMKYIPFVLGGIIGAMPRLIAYTIVGENVTDPKSTAFAAAIGVSVLMAALSLIARIYMQKRASK